MTWRTDPLLALDTETTGTDPESARVVSYSLIRSDGVGDWRVAESALIDPGVEIPDSATKVHGITSERARSDGEKPRPALERLRIELSGAVAAAVPVVLHNAAYDLTLLDREFTRHLNRGLPEGLIVLDTLVLFRRFDMSTGSRTLESLASREGITFPAHDAEADALAALRLLHILADHNDLLEHVAPATLHRLQQRWYPAQQQAAHYRRLASGNTSGSLDLEWPVRAATERTAS